MAAYFVCLRSAARSAAEPGVMNVRARWEAANVSGQVTSPVRHLPTLQGTSVIPSGRLPSDLNRPIGSRDDGTPDRMQARHSMSFSVLFLYRAYLSCGQRSYYCMALYGSMDNNFGW